MLQAYEKPERSAGRVFMGYGRQDDFAQANALFADVLPHGQVVTAAGGHDWPVWRELWKLLLQRQIWAP